jgi:hypothetical protein
MVEAEVAPTAAEVASCAWFTAWLAAAPVSVAGFLLQATSESAATAAAASMNPRVMIGVSLAP